MTTLFAAVRDAYAGRPDHPALITPEGVVTAGEMLDAILRIAAHLDRLGVKRGQRVGLALANNATYVESFYAIARAGAVVMPLNPGLQERELEVLMSDGDVSLVLTDEAIRPRCVAAMRAATGRGEESVVIAAELASTGTPAAPDDHAAPDDMVLFLYSSGSTGKPKRVARTHANLLYETERLIALLHIGPSDRVIGVAPFTHVNGLCRSMIAATVAGATLVPIAQFERRAVAQAIQAHRITGFISVPFMFEVLAQSRWPEPVDFSSLRYCISASAPLRPETSTRFHERYGQYVRQLYGCTETGTIAVNLGEVTESSLTSTGTPIPGVTVDIFDDARNPLPVGETGEIGIRSPAATNEYPGLPEQTQASFRDGYFFPGDIGRLDAEGRVYLLGRKSLFINRGGFKVNPYEIELVLETHPKVKEAAVIGVETAYGDQKVKAVLVLAEPCEETDIIDFCKDKLVDYKIPSMIEFRTQLPKSSTGKLLRKEL